MCVWECFHKRLVFESVNWVKHSSLTNMDRHHLIHWRSQIEQKRRERENSLSLFELGHSSSLAFGHRSSWFLGIWTPGLTPEPHASTFTLLQCYTIGFPGSQTMSLKLIYSTSFLVLLLADSIWWDFFRLQSCEPSLMINFLLYISISIIYIYIIYIYNLFTYLS